MLQLISATGQQTVDALAFLLAFALTALMDSVFHDKLPHDHGRAFAVNGELSKGKARGSGLIFVLCIALVTLAVVPFKVEYLIYTVLLIASMLSGYFDDASETAWNEYKKGLIDFVIAAVAGVTYLNFNGTSVNFLSTTFTIAYPLYLLLIVILIWASINVVNCTDGVDGLSASLAVVSIGTFLLAYGEELGDYSTAAIVFIGALLAYLWSNAKPSSLLMGDAGSRAMGFFLAILALKSGHPFAFLLAALVFIALILAFVAQNHTNPFMPPALLMHVIPPADFNAFYHTWAAKNGLGPVRILNDVSLMVTIYLLLTWCWRPLNRLAGWFLIPLGQRSLYTFILHVYIVLAVSQLVTFDLWRQAWIENTLIHAAALGVLWLMAKYRVAARWIPN